MSSQEEQDKFAAREARLAKQRQRREERKALTDNEKTSNVDLTPEQQQEVTQIKQSQAASNVEVLKKAVRTTNDTIDVGNETAVKLKIQGEQMDRVDRKFDEVEYNLKVSDRLVKGMSGFTGKIGSWFTRKPTAPPTAEEKAEKKAQSSKSWLGGWMGGATSKKVVEPEPTTSTSSANHVPSPGQLTKEEEDLIDAISHNVGTIKKQAEADSVELKEHERKLADLNDKSDHVDGHMKKTTKKIGKLLK